MQLFARQSLTQWLQRPQAVERALGESLTEPKDQVWFDRTLGSNADQGVILARGSRMMYDSLHIYLNGESYRAAGGDANFMRRLADQRALSSAACAQLSAGAGELLQQWLDQGWLHGGDR